MIKSLVGIHPIVNKFPYSAKVMKSWTILLHHHQRAFVPTVGQERESLFWNRDENIEEIFKIYRDKNRDDNLWAVREVNERYRSDERICPLWTYAIKSINSRRSQLSLIGYPVCKYFLIQIKYLCIHEQRKVLADWVSVNNRSFYILTHHSPCGKLHRR